MAVKFLYSLHNKVGGGGGGGGGGGSISIRLTVCPSVLHSVYAL